MKRTLILAILSIFLISQSEAKLFYVATWGNDNGSGSLDSPWGTWQKAFETAQAGDTVYFRGGTWRPTDHAYGNSVVVINPEEARPIGSNGEPGNPICFFNYPGEIPILDCSLLDLSDNNYNDGISITRASFLQFRGLTIRNVFQPSSGELAVGIIASECSNLIFENMTVHDIGGRGFSYWGVNGYYGIEYDTARWINCDAYNCLDLLSEVPGNGSDGWKFDNEAGGYFYLEGCRAWNCGDDGFDVSGPGRTFFKKCWSFSHKFEGALDGNGFKFGANRGKDGYIDGNGDLVVGPPVPGILKEVINCIAADNLGFGFYELGYAPYYPNNTRAYNNFIYSCGIGIQMIINPEYSEPLSHWRNNIIYGSIQTDAGGRPYNLVADRPYLESNNTWDYADNSVVGSLMWWVPAEDVSVTDDDFVSLDVSQLSLPRKADGSLPDITFGNLVAGSDLIDKGVDVGLPYNGDSPDIGAWEYNFQPEANNKYPSVKITSPSDGSEFTAPGTISIAANAVDVDGYISKVEFFSGDTKLGEKTSSPWDFIWNNVPAGIYSLTAVATDNLETKSTSKSLLIEVTQYITSLSQDIKHGEPEIFLFPNPSGGIFSITLNDSQRRDKCDIKIISLDGKVIYNDVLLPGEYRKQFDLSSINPGAYIILVSGNDKIFRRKFIKE